MTEITDFAKAFWPHVARTPLPEMCESQSKNSARVKYGAHFKINLGQGRS